jgi:hypothetical protein
LAGKLRLRAGGEDGEPTYGFFVKKKRPHAAASDWAVAGSLATALDGGSAKIQARVLPAALAREPHLRALIVADRRTPFTLTGEIELEKAVAPAGGDEWRATLSAHTDALTLNVPLLSRDPVGPVQADVKASGFYRPQDRLIALQSMRLGLPTAVTAAGDRQPLELQVTASGRLQPDAEDLAEAVAFQGRFELPESDCQQLLTAAPPGLLPALAGFELSGRASVTADFQFDGQHPDAFAVNVRDHRFDCRVDRAPRTYTAEYLAGPFTLTREVGKDDRPLALGLGEGQLGFTPLGRIAHNVDLAFTASEDAGFWSHHGIDAPALEGAVRRNLAEKRVAVGGSTITMQTAKNLCLTPERTVSRKLQELFLAWHLENVLPKARILELYLNIVEFGPGIYGITHASAHFFGKRPADLNLLESAYLAALLPSPKARYRYFCEGRLTRNFSNLVGGLLRRMLALHRIDAEQYGASLGQSLQFNEQSRRSSGACPVHGSTQQGEIGPS